MPKKLNPNQVLLLIVDIQEKLVNMLDTKTIITKAEILAKTSKVLNLPVIITEQYPKGLGATIEEIKNNLSENIQYFEKTTFSVYTYEEIAKYIKDSGKKQIILCGIEAHVCVMQSALDLLNNNYEVFVVQDAIASRCKDELKIAISRLREAGAVIISTEMAVFELLQSSKHPSFKELQALIK